MVLKVCRGGGGNSPHGPGRPGPPRGRQTGSASLTAGGEVSRVAADVASAKAPFPGSRKRAAGGGETGSPRPASNRPGQPSGSPASALHANASLPKGASVLRHVPLRQRHPQSPRRRKMSPQPGPGCLFMQSLSNSSSSLLSPSRRVRDKRVALAYCLQPSSVERGRDIAQTGEHTRRSVTFNCTTYNQSHQIKALYIFLNNL